MPTHTKMHLKRGTIVEFIGAAHETHLRFQEQQIKDFFDRYGLQVGDKGKIWEGYRGSWIRITWTRQDGTKSHCVPMRSGNFKVIEEVNTDLDSASDSMPELESNEIQYSEMPALQRNSAVESSSVLFGSDSPEAARVAPTVEPQLEYDRPQLSCRKKIQSLQHDNYKLKKSEAVLIGEVDKLEQELAVYRRVSANALADDHNWDRATGRRCTAKLSDVADVPKEDFDTSPANDVTDDQNWDDWAVGVAMRGDVQDSILTNFAKTINNVTTRLEILESYMGADMGSLQEPLPYLGPVFSCKDGLTNMEDETANGESGVGWVEVD